MVQKTLIINTIILLFFFYSEDSFANKIIKGKAKIIDGDTIHIRENKIRLHGIDAPEINQTCTINEKNWNCGIESTNALKNFILKQKVYCKIVDIDRYNRFVSICFIDKKNINSFMVRNGWAIAYRYYSLDYINEEESARKNKLGIWQGVFQEPYLFRKNQQN